MTYKSPLPSTAATLYAGTVPQNELAQGYTAPAASVSRQQQPQPPRPLQDFDQSPSPIVDSGTFHQQDQWTVPPGWKSATRESDGKLYYWEVATGRTSWTHPFATVGLNPTAASTDTFLKQNLTSRFWNSDSRNTRAFDTPMAASQRPDSHQCCALFSCVLFFPLGICAMIHSFLTDKRWSDGRYGDSVNHSRQAYNYSWWGVFIGVILLIYWFFITGDGFPDFGEWFD